MILYRISNCKHAKDVSGTGARLFGGRWNSVGVSMHYMAENRSLAALEVLANKNNINDANQLCLTIFELPEDSIDRYDHKQLPENWKAYPASLALKKIGDEFIRKNEYLLLRVPSAIIEDEFNYLMNVNHSLSDKIKIIEVKPFNFDNRLF
ncbi:RES domain-containing protein [Pedobacter chinensis]|uniref:RES domain-containing protein n=1 Tax=Pedobacter chinensis TaxID=2282421 RepID=A0A369Q1Q8_9SPHI|nr:RES family NAD+ phosphorylase [Pedobacter chinensis]RDC56268.1 RES domain-containing protein [Pedobacter chinensis]